jgi:hypothetical protein
MQDRCDEIRGRLEDLGEQLADVALDMLREATETGDADLIAEEKLVTRARRSVEKAVTLLGGRPGFDD